MNFRLKTTLIATAVVTALGATAAMASDNGDAHHSKVVTSWAAAWNGSDPKALGALFTAAATYTDHAIGVTMTGQEQISGWKERTDALIENVHVTVNHAYRSGGHITIEAVYAGHIKGAPKPFAVDMATLLDVHGHHITADQDFYNLGSVLSQSGLPATWTPSGS